MEFRVLTEEQFLKLTSQVNKIEKILESLSENDSNHQEERFLSREEAAKIAGVSIGTIDNWRSSDVLKFKMFGRNPRIKKTAFLDFLNSQ